ncbi:MAG TPA: IPT/TIG domain-containing protein [Candidatus Limnocylindria bacterium]|jgi:hypothetical protein|nr:IPT/TIG domain-containing protein [Candidatus Limnocylindria bacterium]
MRKITTAVTAAALALSMLATAIPAGAVTGYDSSYAGESAFLFFSPGQTQTFQVFFANTGTTTWTKGTGTQVDLAACLEDKVTCNAQDATEASWNAGWLSAVRYASTTQTSVAPGSLGTFSYNVTAPVGAAAGIYHFNGDLVLASTGERIHPEGYFQDANLGGVSAGAATITSLTPDNGPSTGGTNVVIAGSGFVCTPAFPSVSFGGTNAAVSSCGSSSITAVSPAHAPGSVTVTVTNSGTAASNGLTFTYADLTAPQFTGQSTTGNFVTVTFSEPVCNTAAGATTFATDWTVQNVSAATPITVTGDNIPTCTAADDASVTSATLFLASSIPPGAFVEVTLQTSGSTTANDHIVDLSDNQIKAPQAQTATAGTPETTKPTIVSASGAVGAGEITLNFSEAVFCTGISYNDTDFAITDNNSATTDPTVDAAGTDPCSTTQQTADSSFQISTSFPLPADRTYTVTINTETGELTDIAGNSIATGSSVTFTTGAADFTPPTMVDARMVNNVGSSDFIEVNDSFSITFSEKMNGSTTGNIEAQDQDGTTLSTTTGNRMNCGLNVSCTWNTAVTTLTVTVTATLTPTSQNGTTPGMQIPFNITILNGINDTTGNPPNVLGSSDRLVDFE